MSDLERAAISNAIWLCSNCHTIIDKDADRFPANLLLAWRTNHEDRTRKLIGTRGDEVRASVEDEIMSKYVDLPPHIRQVIRDKPEMWEFMLSAEALDHYLTGTMRHASDLEQGLVVRKIDLLPPDQFTRWVSNKMAELQHAVKALAKIMKQLQAAWGEPGQPGDVDAILHACDLYARCGHFFVHMAEEAAFTAAPEGFEKVAALVSQGASHPVYKLPELSEFLREFLSRDVREGTHTFNLEIDLPDGWSEALEEALEEGLAALSARDFTW